MIRRALLPLCCLVTIVPATAVAQSGRSPGPAWDHRWLDQLRYRFIGPDGNRVIAVVGDPHDRRVYYAGGASGGIWKTTDGGTTWRSIGDSLGVQSVGSLAIAPSDPNVIWAGTGETFIRSNISIGDGIYRSTDAGRTWRHMGLDSTGRIGRIVIDPQSPDRVYAAALGHGYGPESSRGIFRTTDGGKTWERVLFAGDSVGGIDLAMDPTNPRILFAAMWQLTIRPWSIESGGMGGGIWVSRDGGDTWRRLDGGPDGRGDGRGLPTKEPVGKIAVAVARTDPNRVYALISKKDPGLYRSDDGGRSWRLVNSDHDLLERPRYYTRFTVAPDDENRLYFVGVRYVVSLDGGLTKLPGVRRGCGDCHDIWVDPGDPDRIVIGDDGGVSLSVDRGRSWRRIVLPVAQMYHVAVDTRVPYNVYGNRQDGYSYRGPSNSRANRALADWQSVGGCESGWTIPDTVDNRTIWSGCYDAGLDVTDVETRMSRAVEPWPEAQYGVPPKEQRYRFQWTFPIHISPHDHHTVYVGSQSVHRTTNGGQSWTLISPDLTTNDTTKQGNSGGVVVDNLFVESSNTIFAIAESPVQAGLIWVGTMDGLIHVTRDGGSTWTNVTGNLPGIPKLATVSGIEPSKYDPGTAYVAVDAHLVNDRRPYIYRTRDYGRTWTRLTDGANGIPASVASYVHVVREDPVRRGLLYAGTENGIYFSLDDGGHWHSLQGNLPRAPVSWLTVQGHFHDLVVSTYGRGFYILDDITPLRALGDSLFARPAALLPVRPAYRFQRLQNTHDLGSLVDGQDPPYGADLDIWVAPRSDSVSRRPPADTAGKARVDSIVVSVRDASGALVRRMARDSVRPGINRLWWDLRYDGPRTPRLRTPPPGEEHVEIPKSGWRPVVPWDLDLVGGLRGPLVPPGRYRLTVVVSGDTLTGSVDVLKDPNSQGTAEDIGRQVALSLELREALTGVSDLIDESEWVRKQLRDASQLFTDRKREAREYGPAADSTTRIAAADSALAGIRALEKTILDLERKLYDVNLTGAREDAFRNPNQLYGKLASVASDVAASSADFPPTDQQRAVATLLEGQLGQLRTELERILSTTVSEYNRRAVERGVPTISVEPPRRPIP